MPLFAYRARDLHGTLIAGKMEAVAADALITRLADQGLIPITVRRLQEFRWSALGKWLVRRVKEEEVLIFTRQFQTLFKAGLGMAQILSALIRQCRSKTFQEVLQKIRADVSSGGTLAKAFAKHPQAFRDLYINMLAAGEEAGILEESLRHLAGLLEKEQRIKASVKSATLYPKIVIFVLVFAVTVLMTFVVPKFETFYDQFKASLPLPTLFLIRASRLFVHQWYLLLIGAVAGGYAFRRFAKTFRGQMKLGEWSYHMPVLGALNLRVASARFCHILSALYRSGLPVIRALEITGGTIENAAFRRDVENLRAELMKGRSFSEAMASCRYFTPVVVEAVAAGEKYGALDEMLEGGGGHYDVEVEQK